MKDWFMQLTQREQASLLGLALALGLYLLYVALWAPLADARDEMVQRNAGVAASLQNVDALVSEVLALREGGARPGARRNLTSLINSSTAAFELQVSRLQPNSRGEVQVRLEGAAFDDLIAWLHRLEYTESLLVREVSLTDGGAVGRVNATVRIGQAG